MRIETLRAQQRTAVILGLGGVLQLRELWARQPRGSEGIDRPGTGASGGSLAGSDLARASVTFTFNGTGVHCFTVRDRRQGRGAIPYVDGCSCARSTTTRRIRPMTCSARSPGSRTGCTWCGSSSPRACPRRRGRSLRGHRLEVESRPVEPRGFQVIRSPPRSLSRRPSRSDRAQPRAGTSLLPAQTSMPDVGPFVRFAPRAPIHVMFRVILRLHPHHAFIAETTAAWLARRTSLRPPLRNHWPLIPLGCTFEGAPLSGRTRRVVFQAEIVIVRVTASPGRVVHHQFPTVSRASCQGDT